MSDQITPTAAEIFAISPQTRAHNKKNAIILSILGTIGLIASIGLFFLVEGISVMGCGGFSISLFFILLAYFSSSPKGGRLSIDSEGIHFLAATNTTLKWQDIESVEITTLPQQTKKVVTVYPKNVPAGQKKLITDYYERFDEIVELIREQAKQNSVSIKEGGCSTK